jgi:hypothetical protein
MKANESIGATAEAHEPDGVDHGDQALPIGVYGQSMYGHCRSPTRAELAKNVERLGQPAPEPSIEKTEA